MDELTREFLIESQEGLDRMERCLTDLEERPQMRTDWRDLSVRCIPSREPPDSWGFKAAGNVGPRRRKPAGSTARGQADREPSDYHGPVAPARRLRSILKTIEADSNEGEGEDTGLIGRLEELQVPAQARAKHPAHARAGATSAPVLPQSQSARSRRRLSPFPRNPHRPQRPLPWLR